MELNLLEKTELWIENLKLEHADLNRIAETVAAVLNFERGKVLVVDVRHNHITLDILEKTVDAADIFGKQKRLLESLAEIPGVLINEHTAIHSDGILGMIALDESEVEDTLSASEGLGERIKESMLSRAFVFPTGFEVIEGLIRDTNTPFLVEALKEKGFTVAFGEVLDDDRELIAGKLRRVANEGYGLILTTGGVGAESKDRTVEAVLSLDPKAAVPYIVKFKKGSGRHEKDGVRIAAGEYCGALLVTLPGPNDEVRLGFDALMKALQNGFDKQAVAEAVAQSIREKLRSHGEYHTTGVNQNERKHHYHHS